MDFFDKLGKKASEAYKVTADKTGKLAKEAKLKLRMNDLKSQINDIYEDIGKKVYEKHTREENIDIKKDLEEECTQIDVLSAEIEDILQECRNLKDKRQCQKCYKEIDKDAKFCPECGEKQEDAESIDVEEPEEPENVEEDDFIDIEIETEPDVEVEISEEEQEENEEKSKDELEKTVEIESNVEDKEESEN